MKKNIIIAAIAAASALLLSASCQKLEKDVNVQDLTNESVFIGTIDQELGKTILTDEFKVNWVAGDEISIGNAKYTATPQDPATRANFTRVSGSKPTKPYKAMYPYSFKQPKGYAFPAIQTYQDGKFNAPMYAESSSESLEFKNICGVICLSLKGTDKVKSISVSANEALCGAFSMTDPTTVNLTGSGKTVTLDCGSEGIALSTATATKFYIYLPPKEYSAGMKITVSNVDGLVFRKVTTKAVTVERSNVYTFDFDANFSLPLNGEFSVSADKKVSFSQGNLYATNNGSVWNWGFYSNQYSSNSLNTKASKGARTAENTDSEVDLFTWGLVESISPVYTNFVSAHTEDGETLLPAEDWGAAIGSGTLWRTLTAAEWNYLIAERDGASKKVATGVTVCGQPNCCVIAPDNFTGTISSSYDAAAWDAAEQAGLVCLPAAGQRYGSNIAGIGLTGFYWTSTASGSGAAYGISWYPEEPKESKVAKLASADGHGTSVSEFAKVPARMISDLNKETVSNNNLKYGAKTAGASNGKQQGVQKVTVVKARNGEESQKVMNFSGKRSGANTHNSRLSAKFMSAPKTSGSKNITIGAFSASTAYEGEYYVTMTDAASSAQFIFDIATDSFELGKTYTIADMLPDYTGIGDANDWYAWTEIKDASYTETKDLDGYTHVVASMTDEDDVVYNITYDQLPPQSHTVVASDFSMVDYGTDMYIVLTDDNGNKFLFDVYYTGTFEFGKVYTLADMDSDYSWYKLANGGGYSYTEASIKVSKDPDELTHITADVALDNGDSYTISYDEKAFAPTGVKINVDGTDLQGQYLSSYGFYLYTAKWGEYTVQLAFDAQEEKDTYTNDDFIADYGLIYSDSKDIQLIKLASDNITVTTTEKTKTLSGSVYAKNGDEYVLNLVYEKPDAKYIDITVDNATLTNKIAGGFWQVAGQTSDKINSFSIRFLSKSLQGTFTDVSKFDSYNTWVSDKSSGTNVYYENASAAEITSTVNDGKLIVTGTMTLADSKGNPAIVTFNVSTPFEQTWGEWSDFAPFDLNTGKYVFSVLFNSPQKQANIPVEVRKDNTGLKQFKFIGWGKGFFTATGIDLIVDMGSDNVCTVPVQDIGVDISGGVYGENAKVQDYASKTGQNVPSTYDPETGEFNLALTYFISLGSFGSGYETMTMDKPITQRDTVKVNLKSIVIEEDVNSTTGAHRGWLFEGQDAETLYIVQVLGDNKFGTFSYAAGTLGKNFYNIIPSSGQGRMQFTEGEVTTVEDQDGIKLTGLLIGEDEKAYVFNWIQPAGVLNYDTDAPFDAEFPQDAISASLANGVISISATNAENLTIGLELYTDPSAVTIPAGTYTISDSGEAGTALKSLGIDGGYLTECWAGTRDADGYIEDCWFMVEGTVTLSYDEYGNLVIEVNAKNSYGQDVKAKVIPGSSRHFGYSVRLVTDIKK